MERAGAATSEEIPGPRALTRTRTRTRTRIGPRGPGIGPRRPAPRFTLRALGVEQSARLAGCLLAIAAAGSAGAAIDLFAGRPRRAARRALRRERAVGRLVRVLGRLKGPFAKAGQLAALRYDLLPEDARRRLAALQDRVPPMSLAMVRATLEQELDAPLERSFARFEPVPLGAASIAQVHLAALPDGQPVAVKVQYPWLERSLRADLAVARALLAALLPRGSARERRRLFGEFAAALAEELDFEREARVATEIARNLAADPQIVVPSVIASHSTRRVLTVRHHPAVPITDRAALDRLGVSPGDVVTVLARAYGRQIFADGLFHADPHPGNLFVLDEPGAADRPRVLFVDFGLSKRLEPAFRREIRRGIHALLKRDLDGFVAGMQRTGMVAPGAEKAVARAVSEMWGRLGSGDALRMPGSQVLALKDEAKRLLQETPGLELPSDLLLYAKTLAHLFALGRELAPDVDVMRLCLPHLLGFLAADD